MQDVKASYREDTVVDASSKAETKVYTAVSAEALLAEQMCGKTINNKVVPAEEDVLLQMFTPLRSFNSLVPSNLDIQWKIQFTEDDRYFVTATSGAKPTFQITG